MSANSLTAQVTNVQIGLYQLEGLIDQNGQFYVGIPQLVEENLVPPNRSRKQLEALYSIVFQSHVKLKTTVNPKPINAISLTDFERLLAKLDRKGNVKAQEIRDTLSGLSLHQLFCDAFEIKFEKEDRQHWLLTRQGTKYTFRDMTDLLKEFGFKDGKEYGIFIYRLQSKLGIQTGTRDIQSAEKLQELLIAQTKIKTCIELGLTPFEALAHI